MSLKIVQEPLKISKNGTTKGNKFEFWSERDIFKTTLLCWQVKAS